MELSRVTISGRAHRFYGTFMGGEIDHLTNLTIRGLNREVPQIVFYTLANHKGWGVALQDFPISPTPSRPLEGVVYGFEVAAENLCRRSRARRRAQIEISRPGRVCGAMPDQRIALCARPRRQHNGALHSPRSCQRQTAGEDRAAQKNQSRARGSDGFGPGQKLVSRYLWV